jgi:hypothetical protein
MQSIELGRPCARPGKDDARRLIANGFAMPDVEKGDPQTTHECRETLAKLR